MLHVAAGLATGHALRDGSPEDSSPPSFQQDAVQSERREAQSGVPVVEGTQSFPLQQDVGRVPLV